MMKLQKLLCLAGLSFSLAACSLYGPTYFGTKYPATDTVETFYAAKDVPRPYKVIGHMNIPISTFESRHEKARQRLVERAKQIGANGLIFSSINRQTNDNTSDSFSLSAEAFVFTEK